MKRLVPRIILESRRRRKFSGEFNAAAMSIDISGFTTLTEKMMQQGQTGAELLTRVLNRILSPLIRDVYAQGGFVAAFAGDSFTALFPPGAGEDAPLRSLKIAGFALRSISDNRIVPAPSGSVGLGVRIGLSLGAVNWGILRSGSKHTYYFRGRGIEGCAEALAHAKTGEVLITGEFLNSLGSSFKTVPVAGFHRITDFDSLADTPQEPQLLHDCGELPSEQELRPFVLERVLDLVKTGASAEFRRVTATFISFDESLDHRQMNRFVSSVMELSAEYGGYFNKLLFGEKGAVILVLFGAPRAHENDCVRAADFILALRQKEPLVRWMAGSTLGMVYAGLMGCEERCEYTAIGDAVNLAARIAQQKEWGEFQMNRELARELEDTHDLQMVDTFSFKGKQASLPVYRLTQRKSVGGYSFCSGVMVGRSRELNRLQEWIQPLIEGRFAGIMYICGDPGIGKSRLAEEFRRRITTAAGEDSIRGIQWFRFPADDILRKSLNPFRHFLRRYFHQQRNLSREENLACFNRVLGDLTGSLETAGDDTAPELQRTRSFLEELVDLHRPDSLYARLEPRLRFPNTLLALKALFKAESLRSPVILLMEDIQWLDADSMELLQLLTRKVEKYPLGVVCTTRFEDDGSHVSLNTDSGIPMHTIELEPLDENDVLSMARLLLGAGISNELWTFVMEKTAGNPFFVEQLLLDLREREALELLPAEQPKADGWEGEKWILNRKGSEIPTGINAVLLARLDRLPPQVRHTVQTAAVLGREFPVQVLSRMLQEEKTLMENVKMAVSARIWSAAGEFRYLFLHALLRDTAYQMQMRSRLQFLHQMAAEAIEQVYCDDPSPHCFELAYHFSQAGNTERECFYAELAGRQAADSFANSEALKYLGRALELTSGRSNRFNLMAARERVYDLMGMRREQLNELKSMKDLADSPGDPQLMALAVLRRGQYALDTSDFPGAIEAAQRCIAISRRKDPSAELVATGVKAFNLWGISLMSQGNYDEAGRKLTMALERAERIESPEQMVTALGNLGMLHALKGSFNSARDFWNRGLDICREIGDLLHETAILLNMGNAAFSQCDLARARTKWEKALSIFQEIGYRTCSAHALMNLGVLFYQLGSYLQAKIHYEGALSITRETGDRQTEGMTLGNLGDVLTRLGEYTEAREHFVEALAIRRSIGDRQGEGIVLGYICRLDLLRGCLRSAEKFGRESLAVTEEIGDRSYQARTLVSLGNVFAAQSRLDEAKHCYRKALTLHEELGQHGLAAEPLAGLAGVALKGNRSGEALSFVEEILDYLKNNSLDSTGEPFEVYLTCFDVLKAANDHRAQKILSTAVSQLRERAGQIQDEPLRNSFLEKVAVNRKIIELENRETQQKHDPDKFR